MMLLAMVVIIVIKINITLQNKSSSYKLNFKLVIKL